jgi:hypothetical protein
MDLRETVLTATVISLFSSGRDVGFLAATSSCIGGGTIATAILAPAVVVGAELPPPFVVIGLRIVQQR